MYLTRNLTPEASGALQLDQSVTIQGSGTEIQIRNYTLCIKILLIQKNILYFTIIVH
jgi:hypothetical protein